MVRNMGLGVVVALLVVSCGGAGTRDETTTVVESSTTEVPTTQSVEPSSTTDTTPPTTVAPSTTVLSPPPTAPEFGSTDWIGTEFSVAAEPGLGFGRDYEIGEPRHAQVVVGGAPTGFWIWISTYEMQRIIAVGHGPSPYLRTISEDDGNTTITAPPDPSAEHLLMLWSVTGVNPQTWTVKDMRQLEVTSAFLAEHEPHGDCFDITVTVPSTRRVLGWINPDDWNKQVDQEGNWLGADDIEPVIAFDTGADGQLVERDPATVTCRILY